jgi:hypothetical protein
MTDPRDTRIAALEAELVEAKEAIHQAEKAMALCPALKEWGHPEPPKIEHHASRVNTLARQYADCVVSLIVIYDKEQAARAEIERLKGDGERLDWLEQYMATYYGRTHELYLGGPWLFRSQEEPPHEYWKFDDRPGLGRFETARKAIDAAMGYKE